LKAFLFDLDGTLTDPREGITRSIAYALERMGLAPPAPDDLTFAIGPPLRRSLAQLLGDESPAVVERALAHYRERFAEVGLFENALYEGVAEMLGALGARGASLYVATSKPRVYAERIVRHFALDAHFEAIHGCELDGTHEDKHDLLAHLLPRHGVAPAHAAMIGDRGNDMAAARHHGVRAVGALWGYGTREELAQAGAHAFCARPAELLDVL
jgi:phosphoglycolate phosphatase